MTYTPAGQTRSIQDFVTGQTYTGTAEDEVVQLLARWLVSIGYRPEQIQTHPQYRVDRHRRPPRGAVDLALFRDETRTDEALILLAEVKRGDGGAYCNGRGLDQLHHLLTKTSAVVGLWFNGTDLDFLYHFRNIGKHLQPLRSIKAVNLASFASFLQKTREAREVSSPKRHTFSVRKVAKRAGIEPAYLSKIERGVVPPPRDGILLALAEDLDVDTDEMLLRAGRLPSGAPGAFNLRPEMLATVLNAPPDALATFARKVRDGMW